MWKRLGMVGPLSVLAVVFAMAMAASGVGTHVILAQGDDDVESTPACTEHDHSGITQDCANVLGYNNDIMWGASTTTMSQVVDEVWAWSKGVEVCLTPTPEFLWEQRTQLEDRWVAGAHGSEAIFGGCYPLAFLSHYSEHPGKHGDIDFDWHSASSSARHPNS